MSRDDEHYTELEETLLSTTPPDRPPKQRSVRRTVVAASVALVVAVVAVAIGVVMSQTSGKPWALGPTPSLTHVFGSLTTSPTMTAGIDQQQSSPASPGQSSTTLSTFSTPGSASLPAGPITSAPTPGSGPSAKATSPGAGHAPGHGPPSPGSTSPHPSAIPSTPTTYAEEAYNKHGVPTFRDYLNASGQGPDIPFQQSVQVVCKIYNTNIPSVLPGGYWYKIATAPWTDLYAAANTFLNGDPPGGPYSHNVDGHVRDC